MSLCICVLDEGFSCKPPHVKCHTKILWVNIITITDTGREWNSKEPCPKLYALEVPTWKLSHLWVLWVWFLNSQAVTSMETWKIFADETNDERKLKPVSFPPAWFFQNILHAVPTPWVLRHEPIFATLGYVLDVLVPWLLRSRPPLTSCIPFPQLSWTTFMFLEYCPILFLPQAIAQGSPSVLSFDFCASSYLKLPAQDSSHILHPIIMVPALHLTSPCICPKGL